MQWFSEFTVFLLAGQIWAIVLDLIDPLSLGLMCCTNSGNKVSKENRHDQIDFHDLFWKRKEISNCDLDSFYF